MCSLLGCLLQETTLADSKRARDYTCHGMSQEKETSHSLNRLHMSWDWGMSLTRHQVGVVPKPNVLGCVLQDSKCSVTATHVLGCLLQDTRSGCLPRHIERKNPPPPGKVSYLLCSLIKNPEEVATPWRTTLKIDQFWGWFFRRGPLPPGSWFGNHPTKKPPRGGRFLSIKMSWDVPCKIASVVSLQHMSWDISCKTASRDVSQDKCLGMSLAR